MAENVPIAERILFRQVTNPSLLIFDFVGADQTTLSVAIRPDQINSASAGILRAVSEFGAHHKATPMPASVTLLPIPATEVDIQRGRSPTEAYLTLHTGSATLLFAIEVDALRPQCERLLREASTLVPRPKPN
jgi:hypothetical protein